MITSKENKYKYIMLVKLLILYCVILIVFHKLDFFKTIHKNLYGELYVKDKIDINGLLYSPYDFSDISNILLSILINPYGLTIITLTLVVIVLGYISNKWFILFTLIAYLLLIIGHYVVTINKDSNTVYIFSRVIMLMTPFFRLVFNIGLSTNTAKIYAQQVGPSFILIMFFIFLEYLVTYNYDPDLGDYTVNNKRDYSRVYNPKWIFVSFIVPIYIMLYIILKDYFSVTNTFVISSSILLLFFMISYILH